jgi:hypothetical protein
VGMVNFCAIEVHCDFTSRDHTRETDRASYRGRSQDACKRYAQKEGWQFLADGKIRCPQCHPKARKRRSC